MIQRQDTFRVNSKGVAAKVIDGEAIIINLGTGTYYSTENVGAFAWELAEAGHSFGAIVSALGRRFVVPAETDTEADLRAFLDRLVGENLIELSQPSESTVQTLEVQPSAAAYAPPLLNVYKDMDDMLALDPPIPGLEPIPWGGPESKS